MENNPLKQYFRRPAVYLKLPSNGIGYPEGALDIPESGELPVYPMTAIDEITARTPDALFNGTAVAELIKSCVPNIKDPWSISSNDIDAVLIAIRAASGGDTLDLESTCPNCNEVNNYGINLVGILSTIQAGNYDELFEVGDLKIKFRPLTYKEMSQAALVQFDLQKTLLNIQQSQNDEDLEAIGKQALEKITLLTMELLAQSIERIETPGVVVDEKDFILDFMKNCDKNIYTAIRDRNADIKSSTELKPLDITCPSCEHQYKQSFTLDPADFFG